MSLNKFQAKVPEVNFHQNVCIRTSHLHLCYFVYLFTQIPAQLSCAYVFVLHTSICVTSSTSSHRSLHNSRPHMYSYFTPPSVLLRLPLHTDPCTTSVAICIRTSHLHLCYFVYLFTDPCTTPVRICTRTSHLHLCYFVYLFTQIPAQLPCAYIIHV